MKELHFAKLGKYKFQTIFLRLHNYMLDDVSLVRDYNIRTIILKEHFQ